jgi:hypothetical protein
MIKEIGGEWFICHVRFGPNFDEPYPSQEAAQLVLDAMSPANRMLATGGVPGAMTDAVFMEGTDQHLNHLVPHHADAFRKACIDNGGSISGKKYIRQLAKFPGDPEAWVSGRGDVERVARKRGVAVEGMVTVKAADVAPPDRVDVAEDILDREVKKALRGTKGMPKKLKAELREAIKDKIAPKK